MRFFKLPNSFNLSPLLSVKILSGSIVIFFVIYIILSTWYPTSFIINVARLNISQTNVKPPITVNITKLIPDGNQTWFKEEVSLKNHSFICDYVKKDDQHIIPNVEKFEDHLFKSLRPFCDIVPTPRNKWRPATRYHESDIIFVIYTGAPLYQGRAMSTRDTWLSRVTHKYYFSETPYPPLPITIVEGAGEGYVSNMKKLHRGMQIAYQLHNKTGKFYFLAGCDTFVNVPHLLKRLDNFDHKKPLVIGGHPFPYTCFKNKNQTSGGVTYPSGGAGFFFSAGLMEIMYPKLDPFFDNDWPTEKVPYSDVALNCLAKFLGVEATILPGFWPSHPESSLKTSGRAGLHADSEPNSFHYVNPDMMFVLDEFYVFQHIDRLANDNNLEELVKFTRQFVAIHYQILRMKKSECTLPPVNIRKN